MRRNRKIFPWMAVLVPVLLCAGAVPASADEILPTLEQIFDRYVDAMGGREAIAKLETRTITGKQIDDRPSMGPPEESKLEAWADTSGEWTMILSDSQRVFRLGAQGNNKLAFLLNPQGPLMIDRYLPQPPDDRDLGLRRRFILQGGKRPQVRVLHPVLRGRNRDADPHRLPLVSG